MTIFTKVIILLECISLTRVRVSVLKSWLDYKCIRTQTETKSFRKNKAYEWKSKRVKSNKLHQLPSMQLLSCLCVCVCVCVWEHTVERSDSWKWFTFQTPQLPLPTPKHTLTHISQRRLYRNYMWPGKHKLLAHWEWNNLSASEPAHCVCYCARLLVPIFLHQPTWINALAYHLFQPLLCSG